MKNAILIGILFTFGFCSGFFGAKYLTKNAPSPTETPVLSTYNGVSPDYIQYDTLKSVRVQTMLVDTDTVPKKKTTKGGDSKTRTSRANNRSVPGRIGYYTIMEAIVPRGDSIYHWYNSGDHYRYPITSDLTIQCPGGNIRTIISDTLVFEIERSFDNYILTTPTFTRLEARQFEWKGDTVSLGIQSWPVIYRHKGKPYTPFTN